MKNIEWLIRPANTPYLSKRCPKCQSMTYENSGCFRVNANGRKLDIWLIYRCTECKATWNLAVLERVDPKSVDRELYERFLANDQELAQQYGLDIAFLQRNFAKLDRDSLTLDIEGELPEAGEEAHVTLTPALPLDISAARVIAEKLGISQSALKRMIDTGAFAADWDARKAKLIKPLEFSITM